MTKDQFIFEKLAREGECWHKFKKEVVFDSEDMTGIVIRCSKCRTIAGIEGVNPDFTTWEGFGWMWERMVEKEWWGNFVDSLMRSLVLPESVTIKLPIETWEQFACEFRRFLKRVGFNGIQTIMENLINPIRLRDELADYLGWEGE